MKIGILTVPFNNNYGGLLQAYALKTVLSNLGHEVIFINRQRSKHTSLKFCVYNLLVRLHIINDFLLDRSKRLSVYTDQFKKAYLTPITEPYYTSKEIKKCKSYNFDAVIVGSDQVWRYAYAGNSIEDFFFGFFDENKIPKYSYAASFGTETMDYPQDKLLNIQRYLKGFSGISVREESGIKLLTNYLGCQESNVHLVLDPTFLLPVESYINLCKDYPKHKGKYTFTYVLDRTSMSDNDLDEIIKNKLLMERIDLRAQTGNLKELDTVRPVEEWLSSIYYSQYVITDSFHGTVFSIIFHKPFMVVANSQRGISRLETLLKSFKLENRLVKFVNNTSLKILLQPISWEHVDRILNNKQDISIRYLRSI